MCLTLVEFAFLSPSAVLVGIALWLWLHGKPRGWWHWVVSGVLHVASWAGFVLLGDTLAGQLVALREALTATTGPVVRVHITVSNGITVRDPLGEALAE